MRRNGGGRDEYCVDVDEYVLIGIPNLAGGCAASRRGGAQPRVAPISLAASHASLLIIRQLVGNEKGVHIAYVSLSYN